MIFVWLAVTAAVVFLDQWTKYLTVLRLEPIGDYPLIEGWLHLDYVENTGAAFGMFKDHRWFFLIVTGIVVVVLLGYLIVKRKTIHPMLAAALAMIAGGGIGNQIDRIARGYVVDMIYVKIIDFAVFNVADSFVCIGAAALAVYVLFFYREPGIPGKPGKPEKTSNTKKDDPADAH